jgi:hypothetical protein
MQGTVVVTAKIGGLPVGCSNEASEAVAIHRAPEAIKLDEFRGPLSQIQQSRIEFIKALIINNPSSQLYVFVGFRQGRIEEKRQRVSEFSTAMSSALHRNESRATYYDVVSDSEFLQIWNEPAGANPPTCDDCGGRTDRHTGGSRSCPAIEVEGPSRVPRPNEPIVFSARIGSVTKMDLDLKYHWDVSHGTITLGQGTMSITVSSDIGSVTATLRVDGLPQGCSNIASESIQYDPPPSPVKLEQFTGGLSELKKERLIPVVDAANQNPSAQIYILSGHINGKPSSSSRENERGLMSYFARNGITPDRITMKAVYAEIELIQLWIVPAGARAPDCVECNVLENEQSSRTFQAPPRLKPFQYDAWTETGTCPRIWLNTPARVDASTPLIHFAATIDGKLPDQASYYWMVEGGEIVSGQGTTEVTVRERKRGENVTVALEVNGLPDRCKNTVSETAPIIDPPSLILIDEYVASDVTADRQRSIEWLKSLVAIPNSTLFIIKYFPKEDRRNDEIVRELGKLLLSAIDGDRFEIVTSFGKNLTRTNVYLVPDGADPPVP